MCVIFGGAGFIGSHLAHHFLRTGRFSSVHLADIERSGLEGQPGISVSKTDVRAPIPADLVVEPPQWIFNLAAIHREPGHAHHEYFETNLQGARNVCRYATQTGCRNVFFTSSISVYGPTSGPTPEDAPIRPTSPYGASKYPAELIHEIWTAGSADRRLIICRPGVVFGPGDPGNILRMVRAIKRGYFAFPGSPHIRKSYAYIFGLLDSVDFMMRRTEPLLVYNYVDSPTQPLGVLVEQVKGFLGSGAPVFTLPPSLLLPAAEIAWRLLGTRSPIHPVRVRKAGMSTHIVPQKLIDLGFEFRYPFAAALMDWRARAAQDFQ